MVLRLPSPYPLPLTPYRLKRIHERLDLRPRQWPSKIGQRPSRLKDFRRIFVHIVHEKDSIAEAGESLFHPLFIELLSADSPRRLPVLPTREPCLVRFAAVR